MINMTKVRIIAVAVGADEWEVEDSSR